MEISYSVKENNVRREIKVTQQREDTIGKLIITQKKILREDHLLPLWEDLIILREFFYIYIFILA